jgi:uncharacterized protein involved in response to NO
MLIDEKILIPDLLRAAPQVRPILDRYGLRGCGGPFGPVETLGFFAKAHEVPLQRLLQELDTAAVQTNGHSPVEIKASSENIADTIYRPFFKAGIAVVLTLGAVWGAYLLLRIAFDRSFRAVGLHEINAHGQAQIFGWVGLFVMGFAYQAFPRFKHTALSHPYVALASLWVMLTGIVGRSICEPLAGWSSLMGETAVAASVLEVIAIALFVWVILTTLLASGKALEFYDYYILSSLCWFVVQGVYETLYLAATLSASTEQGLIALVATWQGALREIQVHGFALLMILGVSQRFFHNFYGFPAPNRRLSKAMLFCLNGAILGEVAGMVLMRAAGHAWAGLWYASVLLLAGAVCLLVRDWRIFSSSTESDRSLKFLRTAYLWLLVSLGMLVLLPGHRYVVLTFAPESGAAQIGFSHAYYGAIRHAITVGFVSLMIVGVAAKIVPTLNGVDVHSLPGLWIPYILINAGCFLRVTAQTFTDFTPLSFPFAGVSGVLEVIGFAFWGTHLWSIMTGKNRAFRQVTASNRGSTPLVSDSPIVANNLVGDVLERYPQLLAVFLTFGFQPLANPLLRRMLARTVTLEKACRMMGQDVEQLVLALNRVREEQAAERQSLPVLSEDEPAWPGCFHGCSQRPS